MAHSRPLPERCREGQQFDEGRDYGMKPQGRSNHVRDENKLVPLGAHQVRTLPNMHDIRCKGGGIPQECECARVVADIEGVPEGHKDIVPEHNLHCSSWVGVNVDVEYVGVGGCGSCDSRKSIWK